jgi:hypothetical protein
MIQKMSDEIGDLIAALCLAQAEILDTVRPILAKNGLVLIQGCKNEQTEKISGLDVTTTLAHKSGQWIATHVYVPVNKQDAHAVGSALTYGRRYGAAAILAISTDNDDDGNAAVPQHRPQQPQQVKVTGKADVTPAVDDATLRKTFFAALKVLHKDITPDTAKEVFIRLMGDVSLSGQPLNDAIAMVTGHKTWDEFYQFLESHVVVGGK